jgi:hypothetical protein
MSVLSARKVQGGFGPEPPDSKWRVWSDLAWGHVLVWFATFGRWETSVYHPHFDVRLTRTLRPGVHLYFADCYLRLVDLLEEEGKTPVVARMKQLRDKAARHIAAAGPLLPDDEGPPAAAMAMAIPSTPELVDARGVVEPSVPTPFPIDAAPAELPAPI